MNFRVIGKEDGEVVLNENLAYQKREWHASLYYIYLEYRILFHKVFFPTP